MKVLFVAKGKKNGEAGIVVKNQAESLVRYSDIELHYSIIKGNGILAYLLHIPKLFWKLRTGRFDIVHANYSFCGFCASLALPRHLVVSLMGSDAQTDRLLGYFTRLFAKHIWTKTIVKSSEMAQKLAIEAIAHVIPNGVDFEIFPKLSQIEAQQKLGLNTHKKHLVFIGDPNRYSKNGALAQNAVDEIQDENIEFHVVNGVSHAEVTEYIIACDVLLLTSRYEGSPNAIKEALACNKPIVATNVGDISWLLEGVEGCFTTGHDVLEIAQKLKLALAFASETGSTKGREKLISLGLDARTTATKINSVYKSFSKL
jgi:teichuronic acid biosynthesis glycosyltransferase TuaC